MNDKAIDSTTLQNILLVEDDERLANLIQEYMLQQGLQIKIEHNGLAAVDRIKSEHFDLLILDIMLPGLNGLEICRQIRPVYPGPIMMLTAKDEDIDQVVGLELGADDYVTKPVQPRVLLARIRALLRRQNLESNQASANQASGQIVYGSLRINAHAQEVHLEEKQIECTTNEFKLLWLLASHSGQVLSRDDILESLRGIGYDGLDRSVDVRVSRLRKKLGDNAAHPYRIKTIWGKGYLFVKDAW
ncbi:MAG: response regulator [Thiohalomonadales bacterium]